jgi:hypothetical protein
VTMHALLMMYDQLVLVLRLWLLAATWAQLK